MTCPNCGATVAENRRFCGKCGTAVTQASPPSPQSSPPPPSPYAPPPSPQQGASAPGAPSAWGPPAGPAPQWGPPASAAPPPPGSAAHASAADPFAPPQLAAPGDPNAWAAYGPPPRYPPPYPPGYPGAPGSPAAWPGYGYAPPRTNGLAVASLVLGLIGWAFCGLGSVIAIVLGFVARNQIRQSNGSQTGTGMATAGIVLGFIATSLWVLLFVVQMANVNS
jgi:hypothetical protein